MLGKALGTPQKQNTRLVSLNLNGNQITDKGAAHLADVSIVDFLSEPDFSSTVVLTERK